MNHPGNQWHRSRLGSQDNKYVAIYDYTAKTEEDLTFRAGEVLIVLDQRNPEWWTARSVESNEEGYVPTNYIERAEMKPPVMSPVLPPKPMAGNPPFSPRSPFSHGQLGAHRNSWQDYELSQDNITPSGGGEGTILPPPPRPPKKDSLQPEGDVSRARTGSGHEPGYYEVPLPVPKVTRSGRDGSYTKGWFFGKVDAKETERLLGDRRNKDGTFLVREGIRVPGTYRLSILQDRTVHHYCIEKHQVSGYYYRDIGVLFKTLDRLVSYYYAVQDDLCCKLTEPCPKPKTDVWEIKRESVKLGANLGKGFFGTVDKAKGLLQGTWEGGQEVAVKKIKKEDVKSKEDFLKEADMMKELRHPNIVSLYGVVYGDPVLIVTEYMCSGDLLKYLTKGKGKKCLLPDFVDISAQVAAGMRHMEKYQYIHRDLRAANVLVGTDQLCKIADFGMARVLDEGIYESTTRKLPTRWTAPEALSHQLFTLKSDVWSFGVLLYEIFSRGMTPYSNFKNPRDILPQVERGYRLQIPANCPLKVYDVMTQCWDRASEKRPTFDTLQTLFEDFSKSPDVL